MAPPPAHHSHRDIFGIKYFQISWLHYVEWEEVKAQRPSLFRSELSQILVQKSLSALALSRTNNSSRFRPKTSPGATLETWEHIVITTRETPLIPPLVLPIHWVYLYQLSQTFNSETSWEDTSVKPCNLWPFKLKLIWGLNLVEFLLKQDCLNFHQSKDKKSIWPKMWPLEATEATSRGETRPAHLWGWNTVDVL